MLHSGGPINETMNQLIKKAEAALAKSRASRSTTGGVKKKAEKVYQKQIPVIGGGSVDHKLQQRANDMVELEGAGPSLKPKAKAVKPKAKVVGYGKKKAAAKAPAIPKPMPKAKAKSKGQIMEELIESLTGQGMIAAGQSGAGMIAAGHKKPKRKVNQSDKQKRRAASVKKVMKQHNLSLPAASKYVKEHIVKY